MQKFTLILSIALVVICSCRDTSKVKPVVQQRDTTITVKNAYTNLFFDSTAMETFISKQALQDSLADRMRDFYNGRNYQYAWFDEKGVAEFASTFLGLQNQYIDYAKDSSLYDPNLQSLTDSLAAGDTTIQLSPEAMLQSELLLTKQFFRYSYTAYQGNNTANAKDLDWFIPSKKINSVAFLDSLLKNKGKNLSEYEPVNKQYNLLKEYLLKYYELEKAGRWETIVADKKAYRPGDSATTIAAIKNRLSLTGDLKANDSSGTFNEMLTEAVKHYQQRYGLKEDGVIGTSLLKELNRPVKDRIQQLLINMERIRWVPQEPSTDYLLVNIPEYKLHVYESGKYQWSMNVVVGSEAHSTVIFSGNLKHVVFSPYWNVPNSILKKEILPGIKRNPNYLARHNMEWNNGSVRQKPGINNSLGLVKFLFPNSYNIYFHDTPSKSLFNETRRAFSHGCIRLNEPKKLAEFLLRSDSSWTSEKINTAMNAGKEKYVVLKETVPVFIGYFTAWVDRNGVLNFRDDIYGHDKKMKEKLFGGNN